MGVLWGAGKGFKSTNYEKGDEKWKWPGNEVEVRHSDSSSLELSLAWTNVRSERRARGVQTSEAENRVSGVTPHHNCGGALASLSSVTKDSFSTLHTQLHGQNLKPHVWIDRKLPIPSIKTKVCELCQALVPSWDPSSDVCKNVPGRVRKETCLFLEGFHMKSEFS